MLKISFCTVCMNRLHHLKETFIQNIIDTEEYENIEFVLLNYNSQDNLDFWVQQNLAKYIQSGKVRYFKTSVPTCFSHSHSKNVVFRLATGDILCSINADHFVGKGFATYIASEFKKNPDIVLTTVDFFNVPQDYYPSKDVFGKVCVKKNDFKLVKGFDERMTNYGFEDWDFVSRLEALGIQRMIIKEPSFLRFIAHGEEERFSIKNDQNLLVHLLVAYINHFTISVIFLYKNSMAETGSIIQNYTLGSHHPSFCLNRNEILFEFEVLEGDWTKGHWSYTENMDLVVSTEGSNIKLYRLDDECWIAGELSYYTISNMEFIKQLLNFRYLYSNRSLLERNLHERRVVVNFEYGKCIDLELS